MSIYRRFVFEEPLLIRAVRYGHDVDVLKLGAGFAPIAMGEDVMPTDFAACLRCRQLLTLDDLGSRCPGPPPERVPAATEPDDPA